MVVQKVKISKIRSGSEYAVGKKGIKFISLKGDWIIAKGTGFTLSVNPIAGIEKLIVFDGASIPEEYKETSKPKELAKAV